jgi:ribosomal-protein-alanine N-acetyltransferase
MNALWRSTPSTERQLVKMTLAELDAVARIESEAYAFPWTRGNFIDALAAGYQARVLWQAPQLLGYFIVMAGVQEMHLLNLTVAPAAQGHGHALYMLGEVVALCRRATARKLWLEVRGSNGRAREIYRRFGFADIGLRKGYYPAPHGQREDAIVMGLPVAEEAAADGMD